MQPIERLERVKLKNRVFNSVNSITVGLIFGITLIELDGAEFTKVVLTSILLLLIVVNAFSITSFREQRSLERRMGLPKYSNWSADTLDAVSAYAAFCVVTGLAVFGHYFFNDWNLESFGRLLFSLGFFTLGSVSLLRIWLKVYQQKDESKVEGLQP